MSVDLPHNCTIVDDNGYPDANGRWFVCDVINTGEDLVYRSNLRVFRSTFGDGEGSWWRRRRGDVQIRTLAYRNYAELRETIDALAEYPLIDDEDHSNLESEEEREQWNDWGRDELRRDMTAFVQAYMSINNLDTDEEGRDADEIVDALSDAQVDAFYYHRCTVDIVATGGTCEHEGDGHLRFFIDVALEGSPWAPSGSRANASWDLMIPVETTELCAACERGEEHDGPCDGEGTVHKVVYQAGEIAAWALVARFACQKHEDCRSCLDLARACFKQEEVSP